MEEIIQKERNETFDVMKGLTILLVVVGHLDVYSNVSTIQPYFSIAHHVIYSFHMPLFFIVAGYFFKKPKQISSDLRRLGIPYLIVSFICILLPFILVLIKEDYSLHDGLITNIKRISFGSGWYHNAPIFGDMPLFLPVWFLSALFWSRLIFGILLRHIHKIGILGGVCLGLSLLSIWVDNNLIYLPLNINQGVSALVFIFIGYCFRKLQKLKVTNIKWIIICSFALWVIDLKYGNLSMPNCHYNYYVLTVIGAACATFIIYFLCDLLCGCAKSNKENNISCWHKAILTTRQFLSWCGMNSMLILCTHAIYVEISKITPPHQNPIIILPVSIFVAVGLSYVLSKIKMVNIIFS